MTNNQNQDTKLIQPSTSDRFLGRADAYASARPSYPAKVGAWLQELGLLREPVADLGAGTGIFTRLLLEHGAIVSAIEPNPEMRAQLEHHLGEWGDASKLSVLEGTSEQTGLADHSVGLVTAAQAAHWFEPVTTLREFRRVLKSGGQVLLIWNYWRDPKEQFNQEFALLINKFAKNHAPEMTLHFLDTQVIQLLPLGHLHQIFENPVALTRERLHALASSFSYLPSVSEDQYEELHAALDQLFDQHQQAGQMTLMYHTHVMLGPVQEGR